MVTPEAIEIESQSNVSPHAPEQLVHTSSCRQTTIILEENQNGYIKPLDPETGATFSGFMVTKFETHSPEANFGDHGTRTWLRPLDRDGAHILLADQKLTALLTTRDDLRTEAMDRINAQNEIDRHIQALLGKHAWVCFTGLSPRVRDSTDPDDFHNAQHIGIPQWTKEKRTGIRILPPGIYPLNYPERITSGAAQLPQGTLDILTLNREHAFVTLAYDSWYREDRSWIASHGGKDTLISFPGGRLNDKGGKPHETIRHIVQKNIDSITIFLAKVYNAYFDFEKGIIFVTDQANIGLIKGAQSVQIQELTDIAVQAYAREFYHGDETEARKDLAKKWRQKKSDQLRIDVQVHTPTTTQGIEALGKVFGIQLTDWKRPITKDDQMTYRQAEDALFQVILDQGYSAKPDFTSPDAYPYKNVTVTEGDLTGEYGPTDGLSLEDLKIVENIAITTQTDGQTKLFRLHILGIEDDGIVKVAGIVTTQAGEEATELFCVGRIRLETDTLQNGTDLRFLEFGASNNPELLRGMQYADLLSLRQLCMKIWRENVSTNTPDEITTLMQASLPSYALRMLKAGKITELQIALKDTP